MIVLNVIEPIEDIEDVPDSEMTFDPLVCKIITDEDILNFLKQL